MFQVIRRRCADADGVDRPLLSHVGDRGGDLGAHFLRQFFGGGVIDVIDQFDAGARFAVRFRVQAADSAAADDADLQFREGFNGEGRSRDAEKSDR